MGVSLPLPERGPACESDSDLEHALTQAGVKFGPRSDEDGMCEYTLPSGWKMMDKSFRQDMPEWFMVDENGFTRARIMGTWKGTYDNRLRIVECPMEAFESPTSPAIPSETDGPAVAARIANALVAGRK